MNSAFGIEHGDISKAMPVVGGMLRKVGMGIGTSARSGAKQSGQMAGRNLAAPGGARNMLGRSQVKAGQGLKQVSNFAGRSPGLTGGLAAGGAAAGAGAAGGALANRRRF